MWDHSDDTLGFSSWMKNRPNVHNANLDDCVLMYPSGRQYDWRDVTCSQGYIEHFPVSFICQTNGVYVETTTSIMPTTPIFPGKYVID